ncbi:hypothetical protein LCL99_01610 [Halomonas denitrificans]|uniref:hypothetical protein n=1 Tax=Halomonas TaxID=2745 RepID=UPI001A8C6CF0|nr:MULTISPECIES: hypothetical protein [Halomonas]MED5295689.1 hypothetical protein [Pseudomonadota bacterium]MBN8413536.1 hypothetical protein [Halomonas litopenaei]MBY5926134.1 hypothetical protein [Halomonas sp. DP4Y7-2]MBY5931173.1 hypothetical protein [Halomonas sp. DP8Y7-3]MBY5969073.1 hypothetical protein [Halomonas denitrificans]
MVLKRVSAMGMLAGSMLLFGAGLAVAESSSMSGEQSTAEEELRQALEESHAESQPGEGMMEQDNATMLEGSAAATEKRQEMLEHADPGSTEGAMDGYNSDMLEGSEAANEKRQAMMNEEG